MRKSRVEFQVVRPASSREVNVKQEKPTAWPWVQIGAASGLALVSAAFAFVEVSTDPTKGSDALEKSASFGANYALAGLSTDRAVLEAQCGVLADDTRLKSTLATEGMDKASIADILGDLTKTAGIEMSAVVATDGTVLASAGESSLDGIDLRNSNLLRGAKPGHPASDTWVLGTRLTSVALVPVTAGERLVSFLLLGRTFRETTLQDAAKLSQTAGALYVGGKLTSAPLTPEYQAAFDTAATLSPGPIRTNKEFAGYVAQLGDGAHVAKLIFLSKRPIESNATHQAATWIPTGALLAFALISLLSKFKAGN